MKKTVMLFTLAVTLCLTIWTVPAQEKQKDGVFVHLSHGSGQPHRVLMALRIANMMADQHQVLVYFDIDAVDVVLKDAKDVTFSHFEPSRAQLDALRAKKVVLMVCPACLKAAGKTEKDLAPGIQLADKSRFFSFTEGRIITLDY